MSNKLSFLKL